MSAGTLTPSTREHRLGPVAQIPVGEGRTFDVDGEQVAVFRLRSGRLHALSAVCPHRGGPIADGQLDEQVVLCPLHLNAFELATGCSTTGAEPLRRYAVRLDGDELVVTP
ncbi:nitrite reductase (NADH) small subunit [Friedmanniella luteola]|uniref:Nitrite reductase (NADH) small subunit n=1 Tax=Friedmanniella luteola TaxID=546871 RepID=A0A1H1UM78_9ACTN|nr:Rieske (2Fe-2S) protein [Friedmanniella luteola]SDS73617.1 nitrite reductase (NADH) small subunit [Friedmanniella luteola]